MPLQSNAPYPPAGHPCNRVTRGLRARSLVNFRRDHPTMKPGADPGPATFAPMTGTDPATYAREGPGMSAFALADNVVYHTYSTYERGPDPFFGFYAWLDRAPLGRNETGGIAGGSGTATTTSTASGKLPSEPSSPYRRCSSPPAQP